MSQHLVGTINKFGFELQSLTFQPDRPSGICAINIYQCLMMLATGSMGTVLSGFEQALSFQNNKLDIWLKASSNLEKYCQTSQSVELNNVSSVWPHQNLHIKQAWRERVEKVFGATVQPIQLAEINSFIEKGTHGKFKDLVSEQDLEGYLLMLITCLYFKAKWADTFSPQATVAKAPFYPFANKPQSCHMMHKTGRMQYVESRKMQACILPYKSEGANTSRPCWKAAIILPKQRGYSAMKDLLSTFAENPSNMHNILNCTNAGRPSPKVNLSLPRFTLKVHLDLGETLDKLGLGPAFSPSNDFAPISDTGPLNISRVTHDLFIEVNEEGTEMAAVTIVGLTRSINVEPIKQINCDRPFIFLVFDDVKKLVLCSVVVNSVEDS